MRFENGLLGQDECPIEGCNVGSDGLLDCHTNTARRAHVDKRQNN